MKSAHAHTAVLLFTRTPSEEAQVKRFCHNRSKSEAIAAKLIDHTRKLVQQAGLQLVIIDSSRQQGHTFGERLHHAFSQTFAQGYEQIICLGNDTPGLTPVTLRAAAEALQEQDFVFGQATDGGVYLMGMHCHTSPLLDFSAISWNTSLVFEELCEQTAAATTAILAPILADADNAEDILVLSVQHTLGKLAAWLRELLFAVRLFFTAYTSCTPQTTPVATGLRGPPVSC
ncbi:hypothetical protein C8N40_106222 [Pontibacter mucosus]|uniref:Glycosyltransferase A (GT-A) superfamily protein (DUF2064 family) n=1 Tax=Pontibacter mucosus TaxID=1649266 RepID=A0A2T5YGH3_9BACT|nr:DUF2064 domain-containing protein [Pontibacter mucosus]PTX18422.1 hypothetical protein C8N40_106222 [Pontibacter mucosus]